MFSHQEIIGFVNTLMYRLSILILLFCSLLLSQVLTGAIGLRGGINYNAFTDHEGIKWIDRGHHFGLEIGIRVILPLEFITDISYLATKYSHKGDEFVYYNKDIKEYKNLYIPCRLRLNLWPLGFLQPNIELGCAITKQYSGYRQIEYHIPFRYPIPDDELKTNFGLLFGLGIKVNVIQYLAIIPTIHYLQNLGKENCYHVLYSVGIAYGG